VKGITLSKNLTTNEHKIKSVEMRSPRPVLPVKEDLSVLPKTAYSKTDKHVGFSLHANKGLILPFFSPKFPS
jgi:hypothetical protein|tara:strand:+ start:362 stop:577 length:216 start_codon:yes stop_codon:yes gene_type:complete